MPMQEILRKAGGTLTDPKTGGTIVGKSEQPGVVERLKPPLISDTEKNRDDCVALA